MKTKVLVIDDSPLMRQVLQAILARDPSFEVDTAPDAVEAFEKIRSMNPDVLTLDVEMPRMDGLTFLEKLMKVRPMPVVMVSSWTEEGCDVTLRALELGAFDFVTKPKLDPASKTFDVGAAILEKVRMAAKSRLSIARRAGGAGGCSGHGQAPKAAAMRLGELTATDLAQVSNLMVAIGASTGGTEAIRSVLAGLPRQFPGIAIVQHMPDTFTARFAARLDGTSGLRVREAQDGDHIVPGQVLIAPGGKQMYIVRKNNHPAVNIVDGERFNLHRPSVDVMFESCAKNIGARAIGVILTGMGNDGASGMYAMRKAGCHTIAQDEASCVVFGMPRCAIENGAAETVAALDQIPHTLVGLLKKRSAVAG